MSINKVRFTTGCVSLAFFLLCAIFTVALVKYQIHEVFLGFAGAFCGLGIGAICCSVDQDEVSK